MTSTLHHFMVGSMREETMGKVRRLLWGVMTLCVEGREPFIIPYVNSFALPALHLVPFRMTSTLLKILR